ncbi:transglutaminase-like cysteine peptidase [Kordiimonas sp.]|uniref:transglutaminase-like cysteine peptidase n=1 Tax=Kordiimonas sp. TaxID=1970157 RepID=UPI003A8F54CD
MTMATFLKLIFLAFSLSACIGISPNDSALIEAGVMPKGQHVVPPRAFKEFCARNPEECAIPNTVSLKRALEATDYQVRGLVIPAEEEGDFWQARQTTGPGDCEDYALTFRQLLRRKFPAYSAAFRLATAYTEDGQYHAVLSIETNLGTVICDIRYPSCAPWASFPYSWRMREVAGADHWEHFDGAQTATVTAATEQSGRR